MASRTANIYLTHPGRKVQGGLSLSRDSLPNGLVPGILSTTFLGMMEGLRPLQHRQIKTCFEITTSVSTSQKTVYKCFS